MISLQTVYSLLLIQFGGPGLHSQHSEVLHLHFPNLKLISDKLHKEKSRNTVICKHIRSVEVQIHAF